MTTNELVNDWVRNRDRLRDRAIFSTLALADLVYTTDALAAECKKLRGIGERFVPHPDELSGWDDEYRDSDVLETLDMAGKFWGEPGTAEAAIAARKAQP